MGNQTSDPIKPWFVAAEELGEFIGIRFGRVTGPGEAEWTFLRHTDFDGIGGLADILRRRGASIPRLPQIKHHSRKSWTALLRSTPKYLSPRCRLQWDLLEGPSRSSTKSDSPPAVSWHVFDENSTVQIRRASRKLGITVNSFLLKHLTKTVRPLLKDQSATVPWMIPVNLRGGVVRAKDTENHSSYVAVNVQSFDTVHDVHRGVYRALARGEHWANWMAYGSGTLLTAGLRRYMISIERCMSQWNIGSFSNLGEWDSEKRITGSCCEGPWLFAPPVLRCQVVGAGCVTFQNRLSLTIHLHPELTVNPSVPKAWIQRWVREIETDLVSTSTEALAIPWVA